MKLYCLFILTLPIIQPSILTIFTLHSSPSYITGASVRSCAGPSILTGADTDSCKEIKRCTLALSKDLSYVCSL